MRSRRIYFVQFDLEVPGGDYGWLLHSGSISREGDRWYYDRTWPFLPPVAAPFGAVALRDDLRTEALRDGLDIPFIELQTRKVVELDWRRWSDDDWVYPSALHGESEDEPEDYLEYGQHSAAAAASVPTYWRIGPVPSPFSTTELVGSMCACRTGLAADETGLQWLREKLGSDISLRVEDGD